MSVLGGSGRAAPQGHSLEQGAVAQIAESVSKVSGQAPGQPCDAIEMSFEKVTIHRERLAIR
jgi:hypothetical protein